MTNGNYRFGDIEELEQFEGFVLKKLTEAAPGDIKLKLKKLREKDNKLMDFDKNYTASYSKSTRGILHPTDLTKYLPLFDASNE